MRLLALLAVLLGFASVICGLSIDEDMPSNPIEPLHDPIHDTILEPLRPRGELWNEYHEADKCLGPTPKYSQPGLDTKDEVSVHPHPDPRLFLIAIAGSLVYQISSRVYRFLVNDVLRKLLDGNISGKKQKATLSYIQTSLEKITHVALTLPTNDRDRKGKQMVNIGADDGGSSDSGRQRHFNRGTRNSNSWDIADDDTHASQNMYHKRSIISSDLRHDMVALGIRNVTFVHASSTLMYHAGNGMFNYHWRPPQVQSIIHRDQQLNKHYPFFDSNGAGFKISAEYHVNPERPRLAAKDARAIAAVIVKDLVDRRKSASFVGYEEVFKSTGETGHRLCFIAEVQKFSLDQELDKCFKSNKQASL